jgi:hypothetical protein
VDRFADFIESELVTSCGIRSLPAWDPHAQTESIHHSWFLFWDVVATRILRYAGRTESLAKYLDLVATMWTRYASVVELFDLDDVGPECAWKSHGTLWQLNGCVGVYRSILESICGVVSDAGHVSMMPYHLGGLVRINGLHAAGGIWNIEISGEGWLPSRLSVDGTLIPSCAVVPASYSASGPRTVRCWYSDEPPDRPTLLDHFGGRLAHVSVDGEALLASISGAGLKTVWFHSPGAPIVTLGGDRLPFRRIGGEKDLYVADLGLASGTVRISV